MRREGILHGVGTNHSRQSSCPRGRCGICSQGSPLSKSFQKRKGTKLRGTKIPFDYYVTYDGEIKEMYI